MTASAEILAIGSELLLGHVLDTNSHWLCRRLAHRGARVTRVTQLPDDVDSIAEAIRSALDRAAALLMTSGGLGPTEDDRTLEAVSLALCRPLESESQALDWVTTRYAEFARAGYVASAEITPDRQKMAVLPRGATPLPNEVGAAPGVLLRFGSTVLVCLPGVPGEMKAIYDGPLQETLDDLLGESVSREWHVHVSTGDESVLAPILSQVSHQHPLVYLKSRARAFDQEKRFLITLSARAETESRAVALLDNARVDLGSALSRAGISILAISRDAPARRDE